MESTIIPEAGKRLGAGETGTDNPAGSKIHVGGGDNPKGLWEACAPPLAHEKVYVREAGMIPKALGRAATQEVSQYICFALTTVSHDGIYDNPKGWQQAGSR